MPNALCIISDTGMYQISNDIYAFNPVLTEVEYFLNVFDKITWIGFERNDQKNNFSYRKVEVNDVTCILLTRVGGKSMRDKISIMNSYPTMFNIIKSQIECHAYFHVRAPSNPAFITMVLSHVYKRKNFWFKYAGSWVGKASNFYAFQRHILKKLQRNSIVTVNGKWENQKRNVLSFENPCLNNNDRQVGKISLSHKKLNSKISLCFIGGINDNKGIQLILEAISLGSFRKKIDSMHIVGDGPLREKLEAYCKEKKLPVSWYGYQDKEFVQRIYMKSHFLVLASKSEGFPKVVGEAMNYGCIPIITNVSCIGQYINHKKNGFFIEKRSITGIANALNSAFNLTNLQFNAIIKKNYLKAQIFEYDYYIQRMLDQIFPDLNSKAEA